MIKSRLIVSIFYLLASSAFGAFTEFYCQSGGSNLNAGSTTNNTAAYTATNGGWNSGTGVFTPASGDPSASVSVGDFASVYTDGATVTGFVGRVTAVNSTTITVSTTAIGGTAPTTGASGISCKVGGAWLGPNGASGFPFSTVKNTLTNSSSDAPRVNFKNDATYSITAQMSHANAGPSRFQGYTSTVGDGGRATFDGGATGTSYILLSVSSGSSATNCDFVDLIFQNNGNSGTSNGVTSNDKQMWRRCVFHDLQGYGLVAGGTQQFIVECEAYACGKGGGGVAGFFGSGTSGAFLRCVSHDNTATTMAGFQSALNQTFIDCIADTNSGQGFLLQPSNGTNLINCDAYNNTSDGIRIGNSGANVIYIENCNLVKNGGWGINGSGSGARNGAVLNCAFGAGTQVNTSGTTTGLKSMVESGSVTYASNVTPWVDPANGDFRINLSTAKGAGRGAFTQTASSYAGTIDYHDIGAAQHPDIGGVSKGRIVNSHD